MALGADDYIVKPFNNDDLLRSIEKRLEKFRIISDEAKREFNRLFDLSPFGLLLFDGNDIFKANQAFLNHIQSENKLHSEMKIENFIEREHFLQLEEAMKEQKPDKIEIFNDNVILKTYKGEALPMRLVVSEFERYSNYTFYIGLFYEKSNSPVTPINQGYAQEVNSLLKQENIRISEALGEKITNIFKQKTLNINKEIFKKPIYCDY